MTSVARARAALFCAFVAALAVAAYWPVLGNDFVSVDDPSFIHDNVRSMQAPPGEVVRWAFTERSSCNWYPLTRISHALDVRLFGLDPGAHHRTSLLIHAANAVLLFLVLRAATGAPWRSFAVGALFAAHPIQAESVAWISQRSTLLSTFFGLLALASSVRYARRPTSARYAAIVAAAVLGLMAKPMLVTLPLVLLLWDVWPLGRALGPRPGLMVSSPSRLWGRLLIEKAPLALFSAVVAAITIRTQSACEAVRTLGEVSLPARLLGVPVNYLGYLETLALPLDLHPFHLRPGGPLPWARAAGAMLLLAAITGFAYHRRAKRPSLTAGWLWFLVVLLPVVGLLQAGDQTIAERYAYLSTTGLLVAAAWSAPALAPGGWRRWGAAACLGMLLACLGALSYRQARVWHDTVTLTDHALERDPGNVVVRAIRGKFLFGSGDYDGAIHELLLLIPRLPALGSARYNLALALEARGDLEPAIHHLRRATVLSPEEEEYRMLLTEWSARRDAAAADAARDAERVRRNPTDLEARRDLGAALFDLGRFEEAARQFRAALDLAPGQADVSRLLERALRHRPNDEEQRFRDGETAGMAGPADHEGGALPAR